MKYFEKVRFKLNYFLEYLKIKIFWEGNCKDDFIFKLFRLDERLLLKVIINISDILSINEDEEIVDCIYYFLS